MPTAPIYIVIGVSGTGKSTISKLLAENLEAQYLDADDFHSEENVTKMSKGNALTDADRWPWLTAMNQALKNRTGGVVLACSALKEVYRDCLVKDLKSEVEWVVLQGDMALIAERMRAREHFMPLDLLQSQFDTWESPTYGNHISIEYSPEEIIELIKKKSGTSMQSKSEIGLIGLGVMGQSLSRNIAGKGFRLSVYNRQVADIEVDVAKNFVEAYPETSEVQDYDDIEKFVQSLEKPRAIFLMVNAGAAVDAVISALVPQLDEDDLIIDGGNSHYKDTQRRAEALKEHNIHYVGSGVSGGEEGALKGPSIMPGGSAQGYSTVEKIFSAIAAKDYSDSNCCAYIGKGGAGHFVKMVHNGIEYGEMQLLAEVYGVLRFHLGKSLQEISDIFLQWLETEVASYLLEITQAIMLHKEDEVPIIDLILDKAGNKGTGSWTTIAACELGVAIPTLTAALFARYQSSYIDTRHKAAQAYKQHFSTNTVISIDDLRIAYQQARIINHHQGYELIAAASNTYDWEINYKELSRIWTNGCIIRSKLMEQISKSIDNANPSLLLNEQISLPLRGEGIRHLSSIVSALSTLRLSAPCFASALSYFYAYTEKHSLANIIQAQRDYFGAHTYERTDKPRGEKYHTEWL